MATHDYVIDNQTATNFRADLNSVLAAIVSLNSSATAPTTTYANMLWYDTATNQIKKRNEANSAWIILGTVDETGSKFDTNFTPATQVQAEAGTNNATIMTPLRVAQALAAKAYPFQKEYVSSNQTITSAGLLTLAHSLGVAPKLVFLELVCTTAEYNYAVNDVILVGVNNTSASGNRVHSVSYDATNIYFRYGNTITAFIYADKTTGAAVNLTNANWLLRVRAFA